MPLRAIAFDESTSVGRLQQELFKFQANQPFARSTAAYCSKCSSEFAVFFLRIDDPENVAYIKTLEKKISDDCIAGTHEAEYSLNTTS